MFGCVVVGCIGGMIMLLYMSDYLGSFFCGYRGLGGGGAARTPPADHTHNSQVNLTAGRSGAEPHH